MQVATKMRRLFLLIAVLLSICVASPSTEARAASMPYVVVLQDSVTDPSAAATELAGRYGLQVTYVYSAGLKGFAASVPSTTAVTALSGDSQVKFVQPDRTLTGTGGSTSGKKPKKGKKHKKHKKEAPSTPTAPAGTDPSTAADTGPGAPTEPTDTGSSTDPGKKEHKKGAKKKDKKDKGDKKDNHATEAAPSGSTAPTGPSTAPGPALSAPVVPTTLGPTPVAARDDHRKQKDNNFSGIGRRFG